MGLENRYHTYKEVDSANAQYLNECCHLLSFVK